MPNRLYVSRHEPPQMSDRIRAHPMETGAAALGVIVGVLVVIGGFSPSFDPSPSLAELPDPLNLGIGFVLTVGSAMRLVSILRYYGHQDDYWEAHRYATSGQGIGWAAYTIAAITMRPWSMIPWMMGGFMATMPLWAFIESFLDERRIRGDRQRRESEGAPSEPE